MQYNKRIITNHYISLFFFFFRRASSKLRDSFTMFLHKTAAF